jgi:hypothetical protein
MVADVLCAPQVNRKNMVRGVGRRGGAGGDVMRLGQSCRGRRADAERGAGTWRKGGYEGRVARVEGGWRDDGAREGFGWLIGSAALAKRRFQPPMSGDAAYASAQPSAHHKTTH